MAEVVRQFGDEPSSHPRRTVLWVSDAVSREFEKWRKRTGDSFLEYLDKIDDCSIRGFQNFEGDNRLVRHKWEGVYAFQMRGKMFRVFGFYSGTSKSEFVIMRATMKRGQSLDKLDRAMIDEVARIRKTSGSWIKDARN